MKKYGFIILAFFLILFPTSIFAVDLDINSKNAILYNLEDNSVLYQKNETEKISIASMTKIMTAIITLENVENLDVKVIFLPVDFEGLEEANASVAGFKVGQRATYKDLLYGLLLPSGADAARALVRNIAGNQDNFVALMNKKAKELGMNHTYFKNETGLDEEGQYSTVEDVAKMFQYALQNETFKTIIQTKEYKTSDGLLTMRGTSYKNIKRYNLHMDYFRGGKTGTTYDAGLCLASIASYDGVDYMLVTARADYPASKPFHLLDAKSIYEYFMEHFGNVEIVTKGDKLITLDTLYAKEDSISLVAEQTIQKYLPKETTKDDLSYRYNGNKRIKANQKVEDKLGTLSISYDGDTLATIDIYLQEKLHFSLVKFLYIHKLQLFLGIAFILLLIFFSIKFMKKRKFLVH